jgi:hypothetical protein
MSKITDIQLWNRTAVKLITPNTNIHEAEKKRDTTIVRIPLPIHSKNGFGRATNINAKMGHNHAIISGTSDIRNAKVTKNLMYFRAAL